MEEKIVEIFDISYEGSGVGKIDGQIVFVPKTLRGETVSVEIVKNKKSYLLGSLKKVLKASEQRIPPVCPYYEYCGGCDFQHCDYDTEESLKIEILKKELSKIGVNKEIAFQQCSSRFAYRNKIKLEYNDGKLGYFKSKTHTLFAIEKCPLAKDEINALLPLIKQFLMLNRFVGLKSVYIKEIEKNIAICFLFDKNLIKNTKNLIKNVKNLDIFENISIYFGFGDVLENDKTELICLKKGNNLSKNINGKTFDFDISSFNQINDEIAQKLYDYVVENVETKRIINAYSGQGLLTFLLAQKAKFVYGIEYQKSAHLIAEKIKDSLEEYKIENICGKVEDEIQKILARDRIDSIVLDPAREGCQENVLNEIVNSKIQQIIYVSCNFSTLVRDLKNLCKFYEVESVKIFDMFPCTANMETVVILRRKD